MSFGEAGTTIGTTKFPTLQSVAVSPISVTDAF